MTTPNHPPNPAPYGPGYPQPGYPQPAYSQSGYPQPGYPPAPPPPPAKKSHKGLIIGIILGLLVLCGGGIALTGGGDKSSDTSTSAPNVGATQDEQKNTAARMNQPVRDGKFEFVVTNVENGLTSVGESFLAQKAQGQFAVITLSVKNIGDKAQSFSPSSQKLIDQRGREHGSDTAAQIALGGSDVPVWDDINPGNKVSVKLVFDIPTGAVPTTLIVHDSMFSDGVKVSLK